MHFDLLLTNGNLVSSQGISTADLGIKNGKIAAIGNLSEDSANEITNLNGLYLMPGGIDTQVHFREPGLEHKEDLASGSLAALHGGITTYFEMPNTKPVTTSPEALADKVARATGRSWSHFSFFFGASQENATHLDDYETLPGTCGIKIFMGSSTGDLLVEEEESLRQVLKHGKRQISIHAEDEERNVARKSLISENPSVQEHPYLRDVESAVIATKRMIRLSEETGRQVHILHISTADELPLLADAKKRGLRVTCEVTPQHLWFAAPDCYEKLGTKAQMNPPIRSAEHREGLWKAVDEGLFDVFGSDHAPHTLDEKAKPYPSSPSGMPGVETILPVLLTFASQGKLSLPKIVQMLCERPAELFGIVNKGKLEIGCDADLVVFDPNAPYILDENSLHSKCGWSPYHGEQFTGKIESVYLNGQLAMQQGTTIGSPKGTAVTFSK
jgi:dihydroorotase